MRKCIQLKINQWIGQISLQTWKIDKINQVFAEKMHLHSSARSYLFNQSTPISEPGSVSHQPQRFPQFRKTATVHSNGESSNYLLMKNVSSHNSQSFHTIKPSIDPPSQYQSPHLGLASNVVKMQLPLSYRPPSNIPHSNLPPSNLPLSNLASPNIKFGQFRTQVPPIMQVREQEEHNYKFEYMEVKNAYQQLKESYDQLVLDYDRLRLRSRAIENNEEYFSLTNDELVRKNKAMESRVAGLEQQLKAAKQYNESLLNQLNVSKRNAVNLQPVNFPITHQVTNPIQLIPPPQSLITPVSLSHMMNPTQSMNTMQSLPQGNLMIGKNVNDYYHAPMRQLQHENRQLLFRIQEYESSIGYKNSEIQRLVGENQAKQVEIMSLRRQLQANLSSQQLYKDSLTLSQIKNKQLNSIPSLKEEIQRLQQQNHLLNDQNNKLKTTIQQQKQQQNQKSRQHQNKLQQLQRQLLNYQQKIALLENINKYQSKLDNINDNLHSKVLTTYLTEQHDHYPTHHNQKKQQPQHSYNYSQKYPPQQQNQHPSNQTHNYPLQQQPNSSSLLNANSAMQNHINKLTPQTNQPIVTNNQLFQKLAQNLHNSFNQPPQNQQFNSSENIQSTYQKSANIHLNQPNNTSYALANRLYQQPEKNEINSPQYSPTYDPTYNLPQRHPHHSTPKIFEPQKTSKHFIRQSSKLNIQNQAFFDFAKEYPEIPNQQLINQSLNNPNSHINQKFNNQNPPINQSLNNQIPLINQSLVYQQNSIHNQNKRNQNEYFPYSQDFSMRPINERPNILDYPQLPFRLKQNDLLRHQEQFSKANFNNQSMYEQDAKGQSTIKQKHKRHSKIFTNETAHQPNLNLTGQSSSLQTLQVRIIQLVKENKSLRQFLVKKSN